MLVIIIVMVMGTCFCVFNYWFQKGRYNRMTREEIGRMNKMNSPAVWLVLMLLFILGTLVTIAYNVYKLYEAIFRLG